MTHKVKTKTQYTVAVWLSKHSHDEALQNYIANPPDNLQPSFAKDAGLEYANPDFIEAHCYASKLDMFDLIDKVSYGKYFRSECVKMLYPQQFNDYHALIFTYGRKDERGIIHPQLFNHHIFKTNRDILCYAGCIDFEIPGVQ